MCYVPSNAEALQEVNSRARDAGAATIGTVSLASCCTMQGNRCSHLLVVHYDMPSPIEQYAVSSKSACWTLLVCSIRC
jgi:hypothetical protein